MCHASMDVGTGNEAVRAGARTHARREPHIEHVAGSTIFYFLYIARLDRVGGYRLTELVLFTDSSVI